MGLSGVAFRCETLAEQCVSRDVCVCVGLRVSLRFIAFPRTRPKVKC